jgi:hypothetical protein
MNVTEPAGESVCVGGRGVVSPETMSIILDSSACTFWLSLRGQDCMVYIYDNKMKLEAYIIQVPYFIYKNVWSTF